MGRRVWSVESTVLADWSMMADRRLEVAREGTPFTIDRC
jgi:hypothetical protein